MDIPRFILGLKATLADVRDRDEARLLLWSALMAAFGWLKPIWADGGYSGKLVKKVASILRRRNVKLEIVKRSDNTKGFRFLLKR